MSVEPGERAGAPTPTRARARAPDALTIGELATRAGVAVTTLRYYEQLGLLTPSHRVGGKRRFDPAVAPRVAFIRRSQAVGFTLEEIGELLDDADGRWRTVVAAKRRELLAKRDELDAMVDTLDEISRCGCVVVADCDRLGQPWPVRPDALA